ncbi:MAG: hypothetical protein ACQKBY_01600, partial [Verrucomicrobiales bacterium]
MSGNSSAEVQWRALARRHARRVNVAWFCEALRPLMPLVGLALALVLLVLRQTGQAGAGALTGLALAGVLGLGGAAWWRARARFVTCERALAHLDEALGLHNALDTARAGLGAWPPFPERPPAAALRWNWPRLLPSPALALAALSAAFFVPIGTGEALATAAPPPVFSQLEATEKLLAERANLAAENLETWERE